jgi:hypothetical protein
MNEWSIVYIYKCMYRYAFTLEAAAPAVLMVWLCAWSVSLSLESLERPVPSIYFVWNPLAGRSESVGLFPLYTPGLD